MFKLVRLLPYLLKYLKYLKGYKGLFLPFILIKFTELLISFILKAEKVNFARMIKIIYYILSGFNVVLALIIKFKFTDVQLPLIYLLLDTLNLMLPVIIIDAINDYIIDLGLFFKNTLRKLIAWVYSEPYLPKLGYKFKPNKVKGINRSHTLPDPFQYTLSSNDIDDLDYVYLELNNSKIGW
jgi:hypothetical protein